MKISGRNLRRRLQLLGDRLSRAKYYHGHGVHSPFVYGLVRKVFMRRMLMEGTGTTLYNELCAMGMAKRSACQLHNTLYYLERKSYSINDVCCDLSILLADYPTEGLRAAYQDAEMEGVTLVICQPYANRERQSVVNELVEMHHSTSVDNRAYLLLFFDKKLPKQHYRL